MFDLNRLLRARSSRPAVDFNAMLNWKLLRGSHEFPGPDGGTCINEAAIVAAGYPYRSVQSIDDCPTSFSRPMALFAMCLNDALDDDLRQELLMRFVTRLAGSADAPRIELERAQFLMTRIATDILAPALARAGLDELADRCRSITTPQDLFYLAHSIRGEAHAQSGVHLLLISACDHAADAAEQWGSARATDIVLSASRVVGEVAAAVSDHVPPSYRDRATADVYRQAAAILDDALKIGNQSDLTSDEMAVLRLADAKQAAAKREQAAAPRSRWLRGFRPDARRTFAGPRRTGCTGHAGCGRLNLDGSSGRLPHV